MTFWDDVRGGKFTSYAKISGVITFFVLILVGAFTILSLLPAIFSFFFAAAMLFIELPWLGWCCSGPKSKAFAVFFQRPILRAILYLSMAAIMFALIFGDGQNPVFIASAVFLTVTGALYVLAALKKEEPQAAIAGGKAPGTPGLDKERPSNPSGAGYANVV